MQNARAKPPTADLTRFFYSGPDDPQLRADIQAYTDFSESFRRRFSSVENLSPGELKTALDEQFSAYDRFYKPWNYAYLLYSFDINNVEACALYSKVMEAYSASYANIYDAGISQPLRPRY